MFGTPAKFQLVSQAPCDSTWLGVPILAALVHCWEQRKKIRYLHRDLSSQTPLGEKLRLCILLCWFKHLPAYCVFKDLMDLRLLKTSVIVKTLYANF